MVREMPVGRKSLAGGPWKLLPHLLRDSGVKSDIRYRMIRVATPQLQLQRGLGRQSTYRLMADIAAVIDATT
jgi:hypothetical protein